MPAYFLTVNASRPSTAGGLTFVFEPVSNRGGSWLGVLAVEEDSAASTLRSALPQGVEEITFERYDGLKKKRPGTQTGSRGSRVRLNHNPAQGGAAARVADQRGETRGSRLFEGERATAVPTSGSAVTLLTTSKQPPREALLDQPSIRKGRPFGVRAA